MSEAASSAARESARGLHISLFARGGRAVGAAIAMLLFAGLLAAGTARILTRMSVSGG